MVASVVEGSAVLAIGAERCSAERNIMIAVMSAVSTSQTVRSFRDATCQKRREWRQTAGFAAGTRPPSRVTSRACCATKNKVPWFRIFFWTVIIGRVGASVSVTPSPPSLVKVNSVGIVCELDKQWLSIALDVENFRATIVDGVAATTDIVPERIDIERIRLNPPSQNANENVPEGDKVVGTTTLSFSILDPPEVMNSPPPIYSAQEKADRFASLVEAQSRAPWKKGLYAYMEGATCQLSPVREIMVPEGQFDGSAPSKYTIDSDFRPPTQCTCVNQTVSPPISSGCAEHYGLSPGDGTLRAAPWCVVEGVCSGAKQGFSTGWWIVCEKDVPLSDQASARVVAASSEAGRSVVHPLLMSLLVVGFAAIFTDALASRLLGYR
eukprot:TRINITY_DN48434_c0_g1_i1.p1 TRINITY_DN48434_c0_g1~~TRINITY_DN48434_c0_g1_i1.p1  ORF type:complete len:381 (-),score=45.71 TRINITY_DN48434_c0_g1_i1:169-1311(-)